MLAAFASYLGLWIPERFSAATGPTLGEPTGRNRRASAAGVWLDLCVVRLFLTFKTYVLDAATSRAGMLIWMSSSTV